MKTLDVIILNILGLAKEEKLVVYVTFGKNDLTYSGLFILNAATVDEAGKLLETDPGIKEKYLDPELIEWF
ncbi:MAG: hypothetical protein ACI9IP_000933 [Arcticibacterium sp.]|jgi:hypothetical protein